MLKRASLLRLSAAFLLSGAIFLPVSGWSADCAVSHQRLREALNESVTNAPTNGGFGNHEWAAIVARDGTVCAVAFSGDDPDDQWPGSRAIAIEKATTANAFSLDQFALSTANLYAGAQPGGPLYGITTASPPSSALVAGDVSQLGTESDPMIGKRSGGVIVFGGGLPLYDEQAVVGGLGVSGDTSCADHNVAWRVRRNLGLDKVPNGVSPENNDAIIYDIGADGKSASGYGHPRCHRREAEIAEAIGSGIPVGSAR